MTLEDVAGDLYAVEPSEFVAARAARVAEAKESGDKELAAAIGKLRKPTVTAWTVNLLARSVPDEVDALLRLGDALRTAQRELSGDQLRTLTTQRQHVVNALSRRAGALAAEAGKPVSEGVLREVGQTLTAALADPEVADQVRTGTLATAASYEGFGPAGPELVAIDGKGSAPAKKQARKEPKGKKPKAEEPEPDAEALQELEDARAALESADAAMDSAQQAADETAARRTEIEERITALRAELEHAEQEKQFARTAERGAQDELRSAQRQLDRARRWVARAQARVES
ncbi:hypothetical protein SAMN04244553_4718 [Nocardia amikacinitolerans]|uniref:Uncharacterized protein n=1 Tax=Nocardia amikacinitolerans TaxID=756689 RepID=A0A285LS56_9NOCA|nr:hypothetical protein [Nocardia amikacinitolerans]SNY87764.1 hypothetical protein SAMN04244553_4718 [Nocardia amikacinitolerans]